MDTQKQKWFSGLISLSALFALFVATGMITLGTAPPNDVAPVASQPSQADTVEVAITGNSLEAPSSVASGSVTFVITNQSQQTHGFALSGPVEAGLEEGVGAGQKKAFTAELSPGSYTAYCPDHREQEQAEITVE